MAESSVPLDSGDSGRKEGEELLPPLLPSCLKNASWLKSLLNLSFTAAGNKLCQEHLLSCTADNGDQEEMSFTCSSSVMSFLRQYAPELASSLGAVSGSHRGRLDHRGRNEKEGGGTEAEVLDYIFNSDIRGLHLSSSLPLNLSAASTGTVLPPGPYLAQCLHCADISLPSRQRDDDEEEKRTAAGGGREGGSAVPRKGRLLHLTLHDGQQKFFAVEYRLCPNLSPQLLVPGTKLLLLSSTGQAPPVQVRHGLVLLETPSQVAVVGGEVERMAKAWKLNKQVQGLRLMHRGAASAKHAGRGGGGGEIGDGAGWKPQHETVAGGGRERRGEPKAEKDEADDGPPMFKPFGYDEGRRSDRRSGREAEVSTHGQTAVVMQTSSGKSVGVATTAVADQQNTVVKTSAVNKHANMLSRTMTGNTGEAGNMESRGTAARGGQAQAGGETQTGLRHDSRSFDGVMTTSAHHSEHDEAIEEKKENKRQEHEGRERRCFELAAGGPEEEGRDGGVIEKLRRQRKLNADVFGETSGNRNAHRGRGGDDPSLQYHRIPKKHEAYMSASSREETAQGDRHDSGRGGRGRGRGRGNRQCRDRCDDNDYAPPSYPSTFTLENFLCSKAGGEACLASVSTHPPPVTTAFPSSVDSCRSRPDLVSRYSCYEGVLPSNRCAQERPLSATTPTYPQRSNCYDTFPQRGGAVAHSRGGRARPESRRTRGGRARG